jgi:hypothetical protein
VKTLGPAIAIALLADNAVATAGMCAVGMVFLLGERPEGSLLTVVSRLQRFHARGHFRFIFPLAFQSGFIRFAQTS